MKFAAIGHPIGHSLSPIMHLNNFEALERDDEYIALDIDLKHMQHIRDIIKEKELDGFNITNRHKVSIISYLDKISTNAYHIRSVNSLHIDGDKWTGYNIDRIGFVKGL